MSKNTDVMSSIQVLYAHISRANHDPLLEHYLPKLSKGFQQKIQSLLRWEDAQLSLLGRILLSKGAKLYGKNYKDENVRFTKFNKPFLENEAFRFNISHSGNLVACAFNQKYDIGIDLELITQINVEDFKSQMTEKEWMNIKSSNNTINSFYKYWTEKESVVKAHGEGLSIPLKSFEVLSKHACIGRKEFFVKEIHLVDNYICNISCANPISNIYKKQLSFSF